MRWQADPAPVGTVPPPISRCSWRVVSRKKFRISGDHTQGWQVTWREQAEDRGRWSDLAALTVHGPNCRLSFGEHQKIKPTLQFSFRTLDL